jgi:hypothetical protein
MSSRLPRSAANCARDGLDDPPAMLGDERIGSGTMVAQHSRRTRLVSLHQPAVADHVGREDGGEAAVPGNPIPRTTGACTNGEGRISTQPGRLHGPSDRLNSTLKLLLMTTVANCRVG